MTHPRIPILAYHSIDDSESVISVSPLKFKSQMEFLRKAGFQTISLKEITECVRNGREFPPKSIVITFDDGFKSVYSEAFPVLKEFGFKATIFLVTGDSVKDNQWDSHSKEIPRLDLLSWDEIIKMSNSGIDFGSHTITHPNLSELPLKQASEEITTSRLIIQERLGKDVLFFAYPYGNYTEGINGIVKGQFYGACSTEMGFVTLKSNVYSLPRIEMYYFSKSNLFTRLESHFFPYYIRLRAALRLFKSVF